MTTLSAQPPRRFYAARIPSYPRVAVLGLLVSGIACQPASSSAPPPAVSDPATSPGAPTVVVAATPPTAVLATGEPEVATPPETAAPRFAEDDLALEVINAPCRGDCMSPFEIAVSKKDSAQVQARADYCARSIPGQGSATLRGKVGKDGRVREIQFDPASPALPEAALACVRKLVSAGRFTAPDGSDERVVYATFRMPSK